MWRQGQLSGCVVLTNVQKQTDMPHKGTVSNYIQLTNSPTINSCLARGKYMSPPWLMLNHGIEIRVVGGERWRPPASNSSPSQYPFSREQLPAICQYWKALVVFPNLHTWLLFPVRDSAVHERSAVTSHWATKRCQPSQSLIDTHEKSLLVVLLTLDIISWWAVHWQEEDTVKLKKKALPPVKPL